MNIRTAAERPDDGDIFDDETLLEIIAERFDADTDDITRRDAAWLAQLAGIAIAAEKEQECGELTVPVRQFPAGMVPVK